MILDRMNAPRHFIALRPQPGNDMRLAHAEKMGPSRSGFLWRVLYNTVFLRQTW